VLRPMEHWQPNPGLQPTRLSRAELGGSSDIVKCLAQNGTLQSRPAAEPGAVMWHDVPALQQRLEVIEGYKE
jgi:hypothetical protein